VVTELGQVNEGNAVMGKLFKLVLFVVVAAGVGLVGFAYFGDLSPQWSDIRQPVILEID
jgi:hypothetical protein